MTTLPANKYPGRCACCCEHVEAGAGVLADVVLLEFAHATVDTRGPVPMGQSAGRSTLARAVYCAFCAAKRNETALPPDGHYAVHDKDGKLQFFKLARFPRSERRGVTASPSCKLVLGGKPDTRIAGTFAAELVTRALENPAGAAMRYAQELGRCSRCNRTLTDEASRARGLGPECATR